MSSKTRSSRTQKSSTLHSKKKVVFEFEVELKAIYGPAIYENHNKVHNQVIDWYYDKIEDISNLKLEYVRDNYYRGTFDLPHGKTIRDLRAYIELIVDPAEPDLLLAGVGGYIVIGYLESIKVNVVSKSDSSRSKKISSSRQSNTSSTKTSSSMSRNNKKSSATSRSKKISSSRQSNTSSTKTSSSMSRNNKKSSATSRSKQNSSHRLSDLSRKDNRKKISSLTLSDDWFSLNVEKAEKLVSDGAGSMYMRLAGQGSKPTHVKVIGFVDESIYEEYSTLSPDLLLHNLDDDSEVVLSLKNGRFVGGTGSDAKAAMFKKKMF